MNKIKLLKTKKGRDALGQFLVEGEKFVREIPQDWTVCYYACAERYANTHDLNEFKCRAACIVMRDSLFDSASDTVTPQGIMAVCEKRFFSLTDIMKTDCFLLMGECLADPGNIGALIRTALAAGADGVILSKGSGDIYNPKVLRSAAGAVLRVKTVTEVDFPAAVTWLKKQGVAIYAAHLKGEAYPYALNLQESCCFLLGNEAHGLSDTAAAMADKLIKLPMPGGAESLNASVAGSILLYETVRQRLN